MTHSDSSDSNGSPPSLLPYEQWFEEAHRDVMLKALEFVAPDTMPGNHSFYITFQTDYPGVDIPSRVKARYPTEMTIVLQHQFWDLKIDHDKKQISVGLSFGGISSILIIPFGSITGFADPLIHLSLTFKTILPKISIVNSELSLSSSETDAQSKKMQADPAQTIEAEEHKTQTEAKIVSLESFRKKTDP